MNADLAMQRALDRMHQVGISGLSEEDRTLACIWCFESKVANGGFEHFFRSAEGELAPHAPAAFRAIDSGRRAAIAERANAVFGPTGVPRDKAMRAKAVRELPDSARKTLEGLEAEYYEHTRDLEERLEAYLSRTARGPAR